LSKSYFSNNVLESRESKKKTAVKVLGYSREELLSSGPQKFDVALTAEETMDLVEKMKTSKLLVFETLHTTKGGRKICCLEYWYIGR
jgi:hypothetical protein